MSGGTQVKVNHGLAFIGLAAFLTAFAVARTFTTFFPDTVVVNGGIHFHHFWYGLTMVIASGWLGITYTHPSLSRVYALVFGLGGGLIGDEIGLLLTFGNYHSQLTYFFVVGFVSFAGLAILVLRYRGKLEVDVFRVGRGERLAHFGIAIAALSSLAFAAGLAPAGLAVAAIGIAVAAVGALAHAREARLSGP